MEAAGGVGQHEVGALGGGRLDGVEDDGARVAALGAADERRRPTGSAQVPSCSAAAARNVSPAAMTTWWPASAWRLPSLPMVVVLPTPLTPTNSHTLVRPSSRCSVRSAPGQAAASSRP